MKEPISVPTAPLLDERKQTEHKTTRYTTLHIFRAKHLGDSSDDAITRSIISTTIRRIIKDIRLILAGNLDHGRDSFDIVVKNVADHIGNLFGRSAQHRLRTG